ncbi:hypothetical protein NDU88_002035 [Pleurodeles waltl]|uniref:Uncharacterized protein n=1 Tax=Pleurodeles waltl TaxID=8319 RepID=A0AAV7UXS3_PLEWA|nr:hypothetical protein NDU88_002035 [Pleurodeles waltl]
MAARGHQGSGAHPLLAAERRRWRSSSSAGFGYPKPKKDKPRLHRRQAGQGIIPGPTEFSTSDCCARKSLHPILSD